MVRSASKFHLYVLRPKTTEVQLPDSVAGWPLRQINRSDLPGAISHHRLGVSIIWALDQRDLGRLMAAAGAKENVLVVSSQLAMTGAIRAIQAGRPLGLLVYPPLPTPDRVLAESGLADSGSTNPSGASQQVGSPGEAAQQASSPGGAAMRVGSPREAAQQVGGSVGAAMRAENSAGAAQPTRYTVRTVAAAPDEGKPWLVPTPDGVLVHTAGMTGLERAAIECRIGLERPPATASPQRTASPHSPASPPAPASGGHLLIGRANYSAQGHSWAQAVRDHVPRFTAQNLTFRPSSTGLALATDSQVLFDQWLEPPCRVDLALDLLAPASHLLLEDMAPFLGADQLRQPRLDPAAGRAELEAIAESGRQVAVLVHGTAARLPSAHRTAYPFSPFADQSSDFTAEREELASRVKAALEGLTVPLFTATPDMLDFLPGAAWLPVVPARAAFAPAPPWEPGRPLRVAHIPSLGPVKGSALVDSVLRRLSTKGVIEYRSLRRIHPLSMPGVLRQVDVVVDQIVLGNPAVLTAEALAAGRLVVGHVAAATRRRYADPLPVVEADPANLAEVIYDIATAADKYRAVARAGPTFVRKYHDGRLAAQVLAQHFLTPGGEP
ncbi:MAG: hypothetical protein LBJ62_05830 [Bifidobacteriaceae bacterium]|jgi:hypothetical protein|nr:hypothetical protein [Bifidobacteriaceae bacterium]